MTNYVTITFYIFNIFNIFNVFYIFHISLSCSGNMVLDMESTSTVASIVELAGLQEYLRVLLTVLNFFTFLVAVIGNSLVLLGRKLFNRVFIRTTLNVSVMTAFQGLLR